MNLPDELNWLGQNKYINYFYTFDGQKLRKTVEDNGTITKVDYCGPFVYETASGTRSLKYIVTPEGRAVKNGSTWDFEYNLTDHLGNVRAVIHKGSNGLAELIQQKHYYPFGTEMSQLNLGAGNNKYLYNSKEIQNDFDLYWYDYGARFYDPALARWHSIDPLADKYSSLSPYNYVANNPLKFVDPDGKKIVLAGTQAQMQQSLATLQKLTNDQLTVNYSTGVVKIPTLSSGGNLSSGTSLIRELNSKQAGTKTVTIDNQNSTGKFPAGTTGNVAGHMPSPDATNGTGVDAFVSFDPTSNPTITTEDPATGNAQGTNRPNEIGLGHELIHSQHYMTGTKGTGTTTYTYTDAAGNTQTTSDKTEEVNTVGLGGNSTYTENKLRQEQRAAATTPAQQNQLNPRVKY